MLQVKKLICTRNETVLFGPIDITLNPHQALQITGSNGIGKTTLLRTLAGFLTAETGQITLNRNDLCYVGHQSGMHPDLTVRENLIFVQAFIAKPKSADQDLMLKSLQYFGVVHKLDTKFAELSAGAQQRVSLARLYLTNATIWLLDEPQANLDAHTCALFGTFCAAHLARGGMIVFVSHNQINLEQCVPTMDLETYCLA